MSAVLAPSRKTPYGNAERLENGDRLTAPEFIRLYERMTDIKKAELIEGIVYTPSPVGFRDHSVPDNLVQLWLGTYACETPGTEVGANGTVRLDGYNVPRPDIILGIT
jgi:hypothetical protein